MRAILAFPGDLNAPTGGYAYDRALLKALPAQGMAAAPLSLPAGFPSPDKDDLETAARQLRQTPPDSVLLIDGLALGAMPAEYLATTGRPIVALVHHPLARETGLPETLRLHYQSTERAALAACAAVIATSAATGRDLVAHYGVPADRLTIAEPGVAPAPRAAADGEPPRILALGSVIPRKNYCGLVEALAQVADLSWEATLIGGLTFDPQEVARVSLAIARHDLTARIRMAGAVSEAELDAAFAACDLFVHPSLYEGYGMALADALRRGLPMICTTGGAVNETVPDGTALKVPPGDMAAFADALRILLESREARRRLADAAAVAGQALPTWADTAVTVAGVLSSVGGRV
ncbi:glycosyltransferase family 4 protein [Xanthobacteraceae bacterium A53D]